MYKLYQPATLGAAFLIGLAFPANAGQSRTAAPETEVAALPPTVPATVLPPVVVSAPKHDYHVPPGFDVDVALHPYTSGLGPCPEGALGSGWKTGIIKPSHYEN